MNDQNSFSHYLNTEEPLRISIVGAGGKTSIMYTLANELKTSGKVITTTTTRIRKPNEAQSEKLLLESDMQNVLENIESSFKGHQHITLAKEITTEGKLMGYTPETFDLLQSLHCHVINEADGAYNKSIKAPKRYEPVIPKTTNLTIAVIGADALGKPLNKKIAFRLGKMKKVTGLEKNDTLTPEAVSNLIFHQKGSFKNSPDKAEKWLIINKADVSQKAMDAAKQLAHTVYLIDHPNKPDKIFITSLEPKVEIHWVLEKP